MSSQLWACYYADNVDRFRRLLALTGRSAQAAAVWNSNIGGASANAGPGGAGGSTGGFGNSGGGGGSSFSAGGAGPFATSPRTTPGGGKSRKVSGHGAGSGKAGAAGGGNNIGKNEINSRDHAGLTILLRAAASTASTALPFVQALLEHPAIDIYVQDTESGWNALHRALYAGNIAIARLLLEKERLDIAGKRLGAPVGRVGELIKTKDHEGHSPFDLYNSTINDFLEHAQDDAKPAESDDSDSEDELAISQDRPEVAGGFQNLVDGEDLFFFGSNKNLTLGLGDGDDRQFPERVYLRRPDHLVHRFYEEHIDETGADEPAVPPRDITEIPALIQCRPLVIHDVVLSKLHSAVLTTDPISNLYVCGIGRGGRLGLGDENTRFSFVPVMGPLVDKHVAQVALGQNHSMAITDDGELYTWGSNAFSQLGYTLPPSAKRDEDPMSPTPQKLFGPLRKERILGIAASAHHSVAHSGSSLYCWGKNVGQLALMDADSRSLAVQATPRKVAASLFSSPIVAVSAIDKATTCLLANHTVCVFTSYGYNIVKFPFSETYGHHTRLGNFNMTSRYDSRRSQISSIASGGETIAAVTARGDLFTMSLNSSPNEAHQSSTSTTNPTKIRGALTTPRCIWTARTDGVRSVGVGEQGSVIISTHSGAVWRRVKRAKAKDAHVSGSGARSGGRKNDYKFQRVPFIANVGTVRSSAFGAFAAVRHDSHALQAQVSIPAQSLWLDIAPLSVLTHFAPRSCALEDPGAKEAAKAPVLKERPGSVAYRVLQSVDLEADMKELLAHLSLGPDKIASEFGAVVCTTSCPELRVPVHSWILSARSSVLRDGLSQCRKTRRPVELPELPEPLSVTMEEAGERTVAVVTFSGLDVISLLNIVDFMYQDEVIPVWNYTRQAPPLAYRYRQIRTEVMRTATRLNMPSLEATARIQTTPRRCMDRDLLHAVQDCQFFEDCDTVLELDGAQVPVHSALLCQRCPWFQSLFHGRSGGMWLQGRRKAQKPTDPVRLDLKHMSPKTFRYVLQYLYADVGGELFDNLFAATVDDVLDVIVDVLSMANELMLDRLSQICQHVLVRFVDTRTIAHLLNTVNGCTVQKLKTSGLLYVSLQMETMLENHLLDDLDEDLVEELDEVVRKKQLAQMPFARSGDVDKYLHATYPDLKLDIEEERQRRVRELAFKVAQRDDDRRASTVSTPTKARAGVGSNAAEDATMPGTPAAPSSFPVPDRTRNKSKSNSARNAPFSPDLRPKASQADLIFAMEEEEEDSAELTNSPMAGSGGRARDRDAASAQSGRPGGLDGEMAGSLTKEHAFQAGLGISPSPSGPRVHIIGSASVSPPPVPTTPRAGGGYIRLGRPSTAADKEDDSGTRTPKPDGQQANGSSSSYNNSNNNSNNNNPWGPPSASSSKLDLRTIMTEISSSPPTASTSRVSALSAGLDAQRKLGETLSTPTKATPTKMSQKERKKQQQQQQSQQQPGPAASARTPKAPAWETTSPGPGDASRRPSAVPWQSPSTESPLLSPSRPNPSSLLAPPPPFATPTASTNHVLSPDEKSPGSVPKPTAKKLHPGPRAASPDTRFAGQRRPTGAAGTGSLSSAAVSSSLSSSAAAGAPAAAPSPAAPLVPHSKVYIKPAPKAEPLLGLSLADIIVQQQLEQESMREKVAKRSLEEIQQEQAFQEWWDQETKRTQEEEARRAARGKGREARGRGGGGAGGRGGAAGGGSGGGHSSRGRGGAGGAAPPPTKGGLSANGTSGGEDKNSSSNSSNNNNGGGSGSGNKSHNKGRSGNKTSRGGSGVTAGAGGPSGGGGGAGAGAGGQGAHAAHAAHAAGNGSARGGRGGGGGGNPNGRRGGGRGGGKA